MTPYLTELAVAERRRELAAEAAHERQVKVATRDRPSAPARVIARIRRAVGSRAQAPAPARCSA